MTTVLTRSLFETWMPQGDWEEIGRHTYGGLELAIFTLFATVVFEVFSLDTVRAVWKQPKGVKLYAVAIFYNIVNHVLIGVPTYVIAATYCCTKKVHDSNMKLFMEVLVVTVMHSLQYYAIHKVFHESPTLYRTFHRFHHRFNTHVPPSSANAVTSGEYILAYVVPFAVASFLGRISVAALRLAVTITTVSNLIVHTPRLEAYSQKLIPFFWVSTNDHLNHHRKLESHYASPIWNVDGILSRMGAPNP